MKLCTDCKHLIGMYCWRPLGPVDPVTGRRSATSIDAGRERSGGKVVAWLTRSCGKAGRFHEAKT